MAVKKIHGLVLRGDVWYIHTTFHGVTIRERVSPNLRDAERVLAKRKSEIIEGRDFVNLRLRSLTVKEMLEEYWQRKLSKLDSASTRKDLLTRLADEIGGKRAMGLGEAEVLEYALARFGSQTRFGRPPAWRTVEAELAELVCAINLVLGEEHNHIRAFRKWIAKHKSEDAHTPVVYTAEEWDKIAAVAWEPWKSRLILLHETGMRKNELRKLRWEWIDFDASAIRLPGRWNGQPITKARKPREIPLSSTAWVVLSTMCRHGDFVACTLNGEPYKSKWWLDKALARICKHAGIKTHVTPHTFRRACATRWNATDEVAAMAALGHADKETHRGYVAVDKDRLSALTRGATPPNVRPNQGGLE